MDCVPLCRLALIPGVGHFAGFSRQWREGRVRGLSEEPSEGNDVRRLLPAA